MLRSKTEFEQSRSAFQDRADAYNTFVLVGTLLTGFGITFLFEYDESIFVDNEILYSCFLVLLSLVIVLSGLGSVVMALEYYNLKKLLAIRANRRITEFERMTSSYKNIGRRSVYFAFMALYLALALYVYAKANKDAKFGTYVSMIIFFAAFFAIMYFGYSIKYIQKNLRKNPTLYGDMLSPEEAGQSGQGVQNDGKSEAVKTQHTEEP